MYAYPDMESKKKLTSGKVIQKKSIRNYPGMLHNMDMAHSDKLEVLQEYGGVNRPEILRLTIPGPKNFQYQEERRANLISQHVSPKSAEIGGSVSTALRTAPEGWNKWGDAGNQDTLDEFNVIYSVPWLNYSAEQEFNHLANGYMRHAVITNDFNSVEYRSDGAHFLDEQQALFESYNRMSLPLQTFVRAVADEGIDFGVPEDLLTGPLLASLRDAIRKVLYQEALAALVNGILNAPGVSEQNFRRQLGERAGGATERTEILNKLVQHIALSNEQLEILKYLLPLFGQVLPAYAISFEAHAHATQEMMAAPGARQVGFLDQHSTLAGASVNKAVNTKDSGHAADALSMAMVEAARFEFLRGRIGRMKTGTWLIFHQRAIKLGELFTNYSGIVAFTGVVIGNPGWERYGLSAVQVDAWVAAQAFGAVPGAAGVANGIQPRNWAETTGDFYVII